MAQWLLVVTFFGYLAAAVLAVVELYDSKRAKWVLFGAWSGFFAETLWLGEYLWTHLVKGHLSLSLSLGISVWMAVGLYLIVGRRRGWATAGAFLLPLSFALWVAAHAAISRRWGITLAGGPAWNVINELFSAISLACFLLLAVFAIMYIEKERELRQKKVRLFYYQLPALGAMDRGMARMLGLGWPWFTLTVLLAGIARKTVGLAFWPDVWYLLGVLLVWVIYGALFLGRFGWHWQGHRAATGSMLAFLGVLLNFFSFGLTGTAHLGFW